LDCPADDREPEARAIARASGKADERFEDPFALIGGNARPVVGHRHGWTVSCLRDFDYDRVSDRERVVEKVADGAQERVAVAGDRNGTVDNQFDACGRVSGACDGHGGRCEVGEVNGFPVWSLASVEPCEVQEVVD
jgi:hypothetical protein